MIALPLREDFEARRMRKEIHIHAGDLCATRDPSSIHTLLGSCVAVCLYDPVENLGGMNHILLPGRADMKHFDATARYGVNAMELLINRLMGLGGDRRRFIAKAFGGAHVLPNISQEYGTGQRNIEFVLEFLSIEGIRLVGYDLGGCQARRVYFYTDTGDAWVKRISGRIHPRVGLDEQRLCESVRERAGHSEDVTLFTKD